MKNLNKRNKDYAELIDTLTDLSERDFREAIRIAKQFRKAQKSLARTLQRQQRERLPAKGNSNQASMAGIDYEYA